MRLQKFLSRAGVASRREAEGWMRDGRVTVNGEAATEPGTQVDPRRDRVEVDGKEVRIQRVEWILLNKPRGTITTRKDPRGRRTVYGLLDPGHQHLNYVGRLDRETEGLLIFTNDGEAIHGLLHPSSEVPREYRAWVDGDPDPDVVRRLEQGVTLEDGPARAESVRALPPQKGMPPCLRLVVREGRNHEVRRLLEAVGLPVLRLRRIRFGPLALDRTPRGKWRPLTTGEIGELRSAAGLAPKRKGG